MGVGDERDMWSKIMKEVKAGRYAGPFDQILYNSYVQSPIGLVPKARNKTHLIFHLSYCFKDSGFKSINHYTPQEKCRLKYNDLDRAIQTCLHFTEQHEGDLHFGKTDVSSAFRILPLNRKCYKWLILKARNPISKKMCYFVEKCLQFGASISCSHFQRFSNALRHIFEHQMQRPIVLTNYLDDFFFVETSSRRCNTQVKKFLSICEKIGVPIAEEKTEWSNNLCKIVFLGMLLDGKCKVIAVPSEKLTKTINWLRLMIDKKKAKLKELQSLIGLLNFLIREIFPGRVFTRWMYAKFAPIMNNETMKPYHHIRLDAEFKTDCRVWLEFLVQGGTKVAHPFVDLSKYLSAEDIGFSSDATAGKNLGFGCVYKKSWLYGQREKNFIQEYKPSIKVLELFTLCIGIFTWAEHIANNRILVDCDNQSVVAMINNTSSSCARCMILLRKLTLKCLQCNIRYFARHLKGSLNILPDRLSRLKLTEFKVLVCGKNYDPEPTTPSMELWPLSSVLDAGF